MKNSFKFLYLMNLFFATTLLAQETPSVTSPSQVSDPYLWLEDSNDPRTQEWLNGQEDLFNQYIKSNPSRTEIKKTIKQLLDYESYSIPSYSNGSYFFKRRLPSEDQSVLFIQEGIDGTPRVLIDPNKLSLISPVSLTDYVPSPDGKWLAYGLAKSGSDWTTWNVLNISSGEIQNDSLERIKFFPVVWTPDNQGFFYTRLDDDDTYRVYYHSMGLPQSSDQLVYENLESCDLFVAPFLSSDQRYLMIQIFKGAGGSNAILYRDLKDLNGSFTPLRLLTEAHHSYLCNKGETFYLLTNQEAPLGKVIALNALKQTEKVIIPEGKYLLDRVVSLGHYFIAAFSENVISHLVLYDHEGHPLRDISLPGIGTVSFLESTGKELDQKEEIFFSFTNFVQPPIIYHYTIEGNVLEIFKQPNLNFNPHNYVTRQVFYKSKDGTEVPLFIVHKKDLELTGHNETLLYGYGGFGYSTYPYYSSLHMAWLEHGGIFALANIRGGGEFGNSWHEEGKRGKKQNSFDDFISAAEWLIDHGFTTSSKLATRGASNGGLLTAVCLNQRPDLFGAGVVEVGVLDMLRFPLFTAGRFWMVEYGNPQDPEDFQVLYRYSPYHNVKEGVKYPPILVITGDHDDRVVPLHSYKYTAALQNKQNGGKILLRVDKQAGHGAGKSISQWIEEATDILSFLTHELADH